MNPRPHVSITLIFILPALLNSCSQISLNTGPGASGPIVLIDFEEYDLSKVVRNDVDVFLNKQGTGTMLKVRAGTKEEDPQVTLVAPDGHWDLRKKGFIAFDIRNLSDEILQISTQVEDSDGKVEKIYTRPTSILPGRSQLMTLDIGPQAPAWTKEMFPGMFCNPLGFPPGEGWAYPKYDSSKTVSITLLLHKPSRGYEFEISDIRADGQALGREEVVREWETFFPFIDQFGQYIHQDWINKTHSVEELQQRREEEQGALRRNPGPADWNQYGGWLEGPQLEASGHFRVEKYQGKWWLVDPDGKLFWSNGLDVVRHAYASTSTANREHFFQFIPDGGAFSSSNIQKKYGENWEEEFVEITHRRLRSWGLNTIGNWSDQNVYLQRKTPYVVTIRYGAPFIQGKQELSEQPRRRGIRDPFDRQFEKGLREGFEIEEENSSQDPWCIGYFVDNELPWGSDEAAVGQLVFESPKEQPAKKVLLAEIRKNYPDINALNQNWETEYSSWDDVLAVREVPSGGNTETSHFRRDMVFLTSRVAEEYFKTCKKVMNDIAPGKLYLAARFDTAQRNATVETAAAKFSDVVAFNRYEHDVSGFRLPGGIDRPVVIGEFHFGTINCGVFWGGVLQMPSQEERAKAYRHYVRSALTNPHIIGAHWFQYGDQATTGRGDGENGQIGFVDVCDTPYEEMITAAREVAYGLYEYRLNADRDGQINQNK